MSLVVKKFGGSSVATPEKMRKIAAGIVDARRRGSDVVVVVSAMGKTTDTLLDLATQISESPAPRELDLLLASGEQVSSSLLAMAVQNHGEEAVALTGVQNGIVTSASHGGAHVVDVHTQRIREELARGRVVIVAGFQGMTPERELTTLGRGGSDTSAVALAGALGAESCQICTDVDGVFSADPHVVPNARRLDALDYDEMRALALHGARVLHVEAVELARRYGVRIQVCSSFESDGGTWIEGRARPSARRVAAGVAGRKDLLGISGEGEDVKSQLLERALEASVSEHDVVVREPTESSDEFELLVKSENIADTNGFAADLTEAFPDVTVTSGLGSVAAVGHGLGRGQKLRETIRSISAPVLGHLTCPVSLSCILEARHVDQAARILHEKLVEPHFHPEEVSVAPATAAA